MGLILFAIVSWSTFTGGSRVLLAAIVVTVFSFIDVNLVTVLIMFFFVELPLIICFFVSLTEQRCN